MQNNSEQAAAERLAAGMSCSTQNQVSVQNYAHYVSIGSSCQVANVLNAMKLRKQSFPFDFVNSSPKRVLHFLMNPSEFVPPPGQKFNEHRQNFTHFSDYPHDELKKMFHRRFSRLRNICQKGDEKILFVFADFRYFFATAESATFSEDEHRTRLWQDMLKLRNYLEDLGADFDIALVHVNGTTQWVYKERRILHCNIEMPQEMLQLAHKSRAASFPVIWSFQHTLLHCLQKLLSLSLTEEFIKWPGTHC